MSTPIDTGVSSPSQGPVPKPQKSFVVTWLFALLLGALGIDRFYLGKVGTGILKLLTVGGLGSWVIVDLIIVLVGKARDKAGRPLEGYGKAKAVAWLVTGVVVLTGMVGVSAASVAAVVAASTQPTRTEVDVVDTVETSTPAAEDASGGTQSAAEWADEIYSTFAPVSESGVGDSLVILPSSDAGVVTATHDGSANFSVQVLDAKNQPTLDLLVNTIGAYSGSAAYGLNGTLGDPGVTLKITADGNWAIAISPISAQTEFAPTGSGDAVYLYTGDAATLALTHDGSRNFSVVQYGSGLLGMTLLANEIGPYSGKAPISAGPSVISIVADGPWGATHQ